MGERTRIGAVSSADIAVPEHERELSFYSRVLTSGDDPLWREDLMNNLGIPIIGLGERIPEYADLPLQWMPHIQVAEVAASAQRAVELGGSELMHGKDDDGNSQWAVLLDPNGAAFGIIPLVPAEETPPAEPSGNIRWLDLTVSDASAIRDFYKEVVGWSVEEVETDVGGDRHVDHKMLDGDGTPVVGICHERGVTGGLPPVWIMYLPVGNFSESLSRVEEKGGKVIYVKQGRDGEHVSATIQDPVGVYFGLMPAPE